MKSKISKRVLVTALFFTALLSTAGIGHTTDIAGQSLHQTITRNGTQQSFTGSDRYFTGNVKVDMLFTPTTELPASGATVTFEPGYPPGRTDSDRDVRHRADTGMGQTDRRDSHRGHCPVSGRHQALARSQTGQRHDTYGHYRRRSWQKRRMA